MRDAPYLHDIDPFAESVRGLGEPDPVHAALRAAGPIFQVDAPAGGRAWIVTDDAAAREILADQRFAKDTALAPPGWDRDTAGLEPTAAEHPALTTLEGEEHARLRRAHTPLLSAKRIAEQSDRVHEIARRLLDALSDAGTTVDLMSDFTVRFPITVLLDLLGVPLDRTEAAAAACRRMFSPEPGEQSRAIAAIAELGAAGLADGRRGLASELRERVPPETTAEDLHYHLFALIFAGQLTTDAALGFLVADALGGDEPSDVDTLVRETLRRHPPAPFTLWRFATTAIEVAGTRIPEGAPLLVDIKGINTDPARPAGPDLTFGAGPHFCVGAQLAQLELRAVATVLRTDFPRARLAVPYTDLRQISIGGVQGNRLTELPITMRG